MKPRAFRHSVAWLHERYATWRESRRRPELALEEVRRRLELLIAALHGFELSVEPVPAPERRSLVRRVFGRVPPHLRARETVARSDGTVIRLPARLDAARGRDDALMRYRLLALGQAERVARGTAAHAPGDDQPLERDLYLLRESVAADAAVARQVRDGAALLRAERTAALAARPPLESLSDTERAVESLVREALASPPDDAAARLAEADRPEATLAWARATADRLRTQAGARARYRGVSPVPLWGVVRPAPLALDASLPSTHERGGDPGAGSDPSRRRREDGRDPLQGAVTRPELAMQQTGAMTSARGDDADRASLRPDGAATDVASEIGRNFVRAEGGDDSGADTSASAEQGAAGTGADYDPTWRARTVATASYAEWDHREGRARPRAVTVRLVRPPESDGAWAARELREHAALVRQVRHRFERLRARRMRLGAQREGDELDLAAVVRALVERHSGRAGDDRVYVAVRPARRPIAIVLLADVSGSTGLPVDGALRIVDVERIALLLAGEALEALGDPYAMLAFSGRGANDVRIATLKDFGERYGEGARRRVSALEPRGNTRLGAAIRHATALLAPQPAGHRLLLLLSDGQPNDSDHYQGDYAVEDARQAVHEARAKGVFPFCLTVDREAPEYLPRIFGGAHTVLRRPAQLPEALVEVVRGLVQD